MYKKNERAFIHDLSRFMKRNNVHVRLTANWHHVPVGAFQLFLAVHERGGFHEVIILPVHEGWLVGFMVFNTTFNNISVISWQSVVMVEEAGVLG